VGGRRTQSGLYRVRYVGTESTAPSNGGSVDETARAKRLSLEKFHGVKDPAAVALAWKHLGDSDRVLRSAARIALEHQEIATWREKALSETDTDKSLGALLALARASASDPAHRKPGMPEPDANAKTALLAALDRLQARWDSLSEQQQSDLLRIYAIALVRMGAPDSATREKLAASFEPRFPSGRRLVDGDLAQLLVFLQAPNAAKRIVPQLAKSLTQEEQMDLAKSLRMLKTGWTPELRSAQVDWLVKARGYRGGNSFGGFLDNIQRDTVATFSDAEKAQFKVRLEKKDVVAKPATGPARPLVKKYAMADIESKLASGLTGGRNFERGRTLFGQTTCFSCHRYGNEGGAQGPDLTGVAGRFSPRDLLESIIDPSKTVSDQYEAVVIETDDGKLVTGRIVNLNGDTMMVMTNMMDPNDLTGINRRKVESVTPAKNSMMPAGLIDTLKEDEILDLLAYLLSRGNPEAPMFK
jgi:putative heme-binding domain-containing protein